MRVGLIIDYSGGFEEAAELLPAYEQAGLGLVSVAEAYSFDAVSMVGYLAARSSTIELCTSILQLFSRTPTLTAMTAAGLDKVSKGRFTLGIGASGPQVVEGFHGVPYDAPLGRTREIVEICRRVWAREVVRFEGRHYRIPLPPGAGGTGLGKPLKLINHPVRARIPVSVAALGPKNVALAAEIAESWQPLFFHPGYSDKVWGDALRAGFAERDPALGPLDVMLQVPFFVGNATTGVLGAVRAQLALYIGGMGAPEKNFYNQLTRRYGFDAAAQKISSLYLAGRKSEAAAAVPEELVRAVSLIGTPGEIATQVAKFSAAGVTTLLVNPLAGSPEAKVDQVRQLCEMTG
ncbi:LLM class F420-dependent oxidoreductase [Nocardia niigatensis]|uniref:LLM class F420-dependent oxidoreductase n=1 Tax=Nocardia niigatensis TaxID=209249 RepID=UPI0002E3E176|nr:LLM class F420-dependent oxidoreductase [Nocardia niigatensis]